MDEIVGLVPKFCEWAKPFFQVDLRHGELHNVVEELANRVEDLKVQAEHEERRPGKKRKRMVDVYISQTEHYKESAQLVLNGCQQEQLMLKRMRWVPSIERHHREAHDLLIRGRKLTEEGLTYDVVRKRGEKLPLDEDLYVGATVQRHLESAVTAMLDGTAKCIGIFGPTGSGKTNLMKQIYNQVLDDRANFEAVFWATAPEPSDQVNTYHKALQKCVADGMWIDLYDGVFHDEVRSSGKIRTRLEEIGPGRVVIFLDNVKREFPAYDVLGIPTSSVTTSSASSATTSARESDAIAATEKCILVFTTRSQEVCNRMRCDHPVKMDLLEEKEAEDLFLHEIRFDGDIMENGRVLSEREKKEIQDVAVKVAEQCARMPLAIIIIARSMTKKDDPREWRNRLDELIGKVSTIHNEEAKIIEHLKFGYNSLKDRTSQQCFLKAAELLGDDCEVSKVDIIEEWKSSELIGMDREGEAVDNQGHTILNHLKRMCLLQEVSDRESVTMNKWICKMAASVS